ncbi:MAG TPA: UvrD-helicase domain-containing protein [Gemmatimonadaceae bacterium]|nr:UvrD-helicase domain-containing protein [Gemmatimonadaceae bacterium]
MTTIRPTLAQPLSPGRVPSESQRAAIEAAARPLLVLAGPGAGKTFCLIERIRYLLEELELPPERICAFTFTNKAAGEIAERVQRTLGEHAAQVKTGTIHAFCAELLREFGSRIGIQPGFGIADDVVQRIVLRRIGQSPRWHGTLLKRFTGYRFRKEPFTRREDADAFARYEDYLARRNVVDFDMLVIRTAELLDDPHVVHRVRARWDCVLVDEFQDLNPYQYQVVRALARDHGHVFAVGDEEQSIFSWTGADPRVFRTFLNDFQLATSVSLQENRRCSHEIFAVARRLIEVNEPLFEQRKEIAADRHSPFAVTAVGFPTEDAELAWVIDDIRRDRESHGIGWGDIALLYRKHQIGEAAEARLLAAGVPCRLASGHAIAEDRVVAYVLAALRVITTPDDLHEESFFAAVLPSTLLDMIRASADEGRRTLREELERRARELPRQHAEGRAIRRALCTLGNLGAIGHRHDTLMRLVEELLANRIGPSRSVLEEHHDELTDPMAHEEVVRLGTRLRDVQVSGRPVWLARAHGAEIGLKGLLVGAGIHRVQLGDVPPADAERIVAEDAPSLGLPLALFKALQLLHAGDVANRLTSFTAVDIETTDKHVDTAEVVEIAAVRVRDRMIVDEWVSLVRPEGPISPAARKAHHITDEMVAGERCFADVWPEYRAFCGDDVLVAHNGFGFDFPILRRLGGAAGSSSYDTLPLARSLQPTSAKLADLARCFGIDTGTSHRALDDTRTLARVCLALHDLSAEVTRKTSLVNLLDNLGIALALWPGDPGPEAELLRGLCRPYAFGRFSDCLDAYEAERELAGDPSLPTVHQLIDWLGGAKMMERVRAGAEKTADERYPAAMTRMRRLIDQCAEGSLHEQIARFLERIALSKSDGLDAARGRVNLFTMHSTKGLEFSRVYVIGVEDSELPGDSPARGRAASRAEVEESRRLLYVGMTRAKDRLVLTRVEARNGQPTGGHRFVDEMGLRLQVSS